MSDISEESFRALRVIRTNGINIDDEGELTGVFSRFSRVNHSCAPSAVRNIDINTGEIRLNAARDIEKGEEQESFNGKDAINEDEKGGLKEVVIGQLGQMLE